MKRIPLQNGPMSHWQNAQVIPSMCCASISLNPTHTGKRCPPPIKPRNGFVNYPWATANEFGTEIRYSCEDGYDIKGYERGRCNQESTWGAVPECVRKISALLLKYTGQLINTLFFHLIFILFLYLTWYMITIKLCWLTVLTMQFQ